MQRLLALHNRRLKKLRDIIFCASVELLVLLSAVLQLTWGLLLLNPWTDVFKQSAIWNAMHGIAPEWAWGIYYAAIGLATLTALVDSAYRWLRVTTFWSTCVWCFTANMFFYSNSRSVSWPTYLILAVFTGVAYIRLGKQRRGQQCRGSFRS